MEGKVGGGGNGGKKPKEEERERRGKTYHPILPNYQCKWMRLNDTISLVKRRAIIDTRAHKNGRLEEERVTL